MIPDAFSVGVLLAGLSDVTQTIPWHWLAFFQLQERTHSIVYLEKTAAKAKQQLEEVCAMTSKTCSAALYWQLP